MTDSLKCGCCGGPADLLMRQIVEPVSAEGRAFVERAGEDRHVAGICIACCKWASEQAQQRNERNEREHALGGQPS